MVCMANDPVCDSTGLAADMSYLSQHFVYTVRQPAVVQASAATARRIMSIPAPRPRTVVLEAAVGSRINYQLIADVDPDYVLEWQVVGESTLPVGLKLSKLGRISGTVKALSVSTTLIRVRASILVVGFVNSSGVSSGSR
jgi:hypothetical protein